MSRSGRSHQFAEWQASCNDIRRRSKKKTTVTDQACPLSLISSQFISCAPKLWKHVLSCSAVRVILWGGFFLASRPESNRKSLNVVGWIAVNECHFRFWHFERRYNHQRGIARLVQEVEACERTKFCPLTALLGYLGRSSYWPLFRVPIPEDVRSNCHDHWCAILCGFFTKPRRSNRYDRSGVEEKCQLSATETAAHIGSESVAVYSELKPSADSTRRLRNPVYHKISTLSSHGRAASRNRAVPPNHGR